MDFVPTTVFLPTVMFVAATRRRNVIHALRGTTKTVTTLHASACVARSRQLMDCRALIVPRSCTRINTMPRKGRAPPYRARAPQPNILIRAPSTPLTRALWQRARSVRSPQAMDCHALIVPRNCNRINIIIRKGRAPPYRARRPPQPNT